MNLWTSPYPGIITDLLDQNVPLVLIAGGVLSFLSCVILAFSRAFREYMAYEPGPEEVVKEDGYQVES